MLFDLLAIKRRYIPMAETRLVWFLSKTICWFKSTILCTWRYILAYFHNSWFSSKIWRTVALKNASKTLIRSINYLDLSCLLKYISRGDKPGIHAMIRVNYSLDMTQQSSLNSKRALVVWKSNRNAGYQFKQVCCITYIYNKVHVGIKVKSWQ